MAVELHPTAEQKLADLCAVTNQTASQLASDAVERLHRALVGLPVQHDDAPKLETGPFRKRYSYNPAEIVLRQSDIADFTLEEPFRVIDDLGDDCWIVDGEVSDLASVPPFLTWLVPRYGRHTFAALLHDHLQDPHVEHPVTSAEADTVFRNAMADTGVPLLVRWLMWAAVSARTRVKGGGIGRYATAAWVGAYVLLGALGFPTALLALAAGGITLVQWSVLTAVVLASPFVLGLLWRRDYRFAVLTGAAGLVVALPSLLDLVVATVLEILDRRRRRQQLLSAR
jgi:hypothetical protein